MKSPLQKLRMHYQPELPPVLKDVNAIELVPQNSALSVRPEIKALFPNSSRDSFVKFTKGRVRPSSPKCVGVVFSGGQAAGGHNVISGLFDALKQIHPKSKLIGFLNGPKGIIENKFIEISEATLAPYRNQGGFDLLGSGRTKIETPEQFQAAENAAIKNKLDGLVIIGGDDSNTIAAHLAEYFLSKKCPTKVIGVPKTIDGDLKSKEIEITFGFDTACKTYSDIIGNILIDTLSAKKAYFFIKLMGRSASHITLECALQTHPNMAIIGEEVAQNNTTMQQLVNEIADMICKRSDQGKDYGVILIPEGVIEFIPEFKQLISELNSLLSKNVNAESISSLLSQPTLSCFSSMPKEQQTQILMDRDPHGNVQVSKIETERLFIEMVKSELKKRKSEGKYKGSFSPQPHFCGYEGRSSLPSNFDAKYCYALGFVAAALIKESATGYVCAIQNLSKPVSDWCVGASNLVAMLGLEKRHGKDVPAIKKALVNLHGAPFKKFSQLKEQWKFNDNYVTPGPIQFFGPKEITDCITETLSLEGSQ